MVEAPFCGQLVQVAASGAIYYTRELYVDGVDLRGAQAPSWIAKIKDQLSTVPHPITHKPHIYLLCTGSSANTI